MRDDLPFGWRRERLSGLCLKSNQKDPRKDPDSSFIYVDVSSISNHSFSIIDTNRIIGKDAPSRARKLIQKDDVIFATVRPTLKRVALVTEEFDGQICSTGFCVLRANKDLLDPNFLYYYLLTEGVNNRVEGLQKGATYPAISDSDLFNQTILLPPPSEQRAIARALRAVQGAREARLRELVLERERKAALMEHLFTHGTRGEATKMTEIGEMPESWKIGKLGDFIKFKSGESRPANMVSKSEAEKIVPVYGGNGIMGYTNDIFSEKEHLIIGRVGEYCGCIHISETPNWITDNALYSEKWLDNRFGFDFAASYLNYLNLNQFKRKAGQPLLTQGVLKEIKIYLPSIEEQSMIATVSRSCDSRIAALEHEARLHQELFRAMLEELMSGRLPAGALEEDAD